jgi:hypothetical protein
MVDQLRDDHRWPNMADYHHWLTTQRIFVATGFQVDPALTYPQLMDSFLQQKARQSNKPIVGATIHRHFDRILRIWPEARFIHLIRDGRDVARSCVTMGWAGNVWTGCERWIEAEQLWQRMAAQLPRERWTELTHEQLTREPEQSLADLCRFIGVDHDDAMLRYSDNTTYERPDPTLLEQWRRKLAPDQVQLVESRIGDMLVERGYPLSDLPQITVSPARQAALRLHDRWGRMRFRQRRLGLPLWSADVISRRIGTQRWQEKVRQRIWQDTRKYIK